MTEIVRYDSMDDLERLGKAMVASGYFEDAASISKAVVKILAGREMGFGPIASMNGIHVIKGKPAVGANLMAAKVKASGRYNYRVKRLDDTGCTIAFFENGEAIGESTFTAQDAQKAGTQNMGKFPRNMLFARAMSNGVKWFCPDVFLSGPVYTPEELGEIVDDNGIVEMPTITVEKPQELPFDESADAAAVAAIAEQSRKTAQAQEPSADIDYDGNLIDEGKAVSATLPTDCPTNTWVAFADYALANIPGYKNRMHIVNTLKADVGQGDWSPFKGALINGDPVTFWAALVNHKHES